MISIVHYKKLAVVLALLFLTSCAAKTSYYNSMNDFVAQGKYLDAAVLAEKSKGDIYGEKNALLYYLDEAMLLHLAGRYAESNDHFEKAKKLSQEYFTKSVTTEASTLLVNDNMRPYYGEDFERALISVFSAMNYVMLGRPNEALVEARQVDHFLKTLKTNYGYNNKYKEDAFTRYLMGMLYENQGQINDAFISYRQALDAYAAGIKIYGVAMPRALVSDALRTARQLGFNDEIREISRAWGTPADRDASSSDGELVVLDYNGRGAEKVETFFEIAFGKAWGFVGMVSPRGEEARQAEEATAIARSILFDEQIRMSFPKYVRTPYRMTKAGAVLAADGADARSEVVDDISALAEQSLDDRINRIRVRTIARAAIKYALVHRISQKVEQESGNKALGWISKKALAAGSAAIEHADIRSWRSLPDKILMTRMTLPAGAHTVVFKGYDDQGRELHRQTISVVIKPGKKTFAILRTML